MSANTPAIPPAGTPFVLVGQSQSLNAQKVALLLAMAETPFQLEIVDLRNGAHKDAAYETLNPFGRVPTLKHGDVVLYQTLNQMRYIARRTGKFYSENELEAYAIEDWFHFTVDYLSQGLARLRFVNRFQGGEPKYVKDYFRPNMLRGLDILQRRLVDHDWLALDRPTLADLGAHPFVAVWPDAEVEISDWPAVAAWLERVRDLPHYREPEAMLVDMTT